MPPTSTLNLISCRWDWCRSSFASIDALDSHVNHEHIWPMKPMRMADIALMRRMDSQSLHSSQDTDSSIISRGLIVGVSRNEAVPPSSTPKKRPENGVFDTFTQLSSPLQAHSPQSLPASPALEGLMRQDGRFELSAAVETFERARAHKANQHLPPYQRSPTHRPISESSGSSQEVVERHLTQEDVVLSQPWSLLPSVRDIEDELVGAEPMWPPDNEPGAVATKGIVDSEQSVSKQIYPRGTSPDSPRGRNFRYMPLGVHSQSASPPHTSQETHSQSQPIILQTQAPYSSQAMGWSQTQ